MAQAVAERRQERGVSRPLKLLVPLIKDDLRRADAAGMEFYRRAGDKLREARGQVPSHRWSAWLTKNFSLGRTTAWSYMRLSEMYEDAGDSSARRTIDTGSLRELTEHRTTRETEHRTVKKSLNDAIADVDVDYLARERESRDKEVTLHRDLALELIDIGYKALATRLHPDRGGSKDAMRRLNRVRDELKSLAEIRRFE